MSESETRIVPEPAEQKAARRLNASIQSANATLSQLQDFAESYNKMAAELQAARAELKMLKAERDKLKALKGVAKAKP